jgi:O-antigen/teichoic acid export membrane protein
VTGTSENVARRNRVGLLRRGWQFLGKHSRYGFAILGPVSAAGSQFILSLRVLHLVTQSSFGSFSFLLIASQLALGISSALFCAPLPVLLSQRDGKGKEALFRCVLDANTCMGGVALLLFCCLAFWLGLTAPESVLFGCYGALMLLRWFARAYAYAIGIQWRTVTSDIIYGVVLLCGIALMAPADTSLAAPLAVLLIASAFSFAPFGGSYLRRQFFRFSLAHLSRYGEIWRKHSSWSLTGVLSTEATANAQAYIVTLIAGPADFAIVAASALLIRPITVAMNALAEFERPQFSRYYIEGGIDAVVTPMRYFGFALTGVWIATAATSAMLLLYSPHLVFPAKYRYADLLLGTVLWMLVAAVRLARTPHSTLLQAAGEFRTLAFASVLSSGISVFGALLFLFIGGPICSTIGILLGETIFAILIWRQTLRWKVALAKAAVDDDAKTICA